MIGLAKKAPARDFAAEAEAMIPDVRAKFPKLLRAMKTAHAKDAASYSFEARRHGDFLALFIVRDGQSLVTSVNLAASRQITLTPGRAIDTGGTLPFYRAWADNGEAVSVGSLEPRRGAYPMFKLDPEPQQSNGGNGMHMWHMGIGGQLPKVDAAPRHAADDEIRFEGVKGTLFVPFGRGQEVYDAILSAIASRKR